MVMGKPNRNMKKIKAPHDDLLKKMLKRHRNVIRVDNPGSARYLGRFESLVISRSRNNDTFLIALGKIKPVREARDGTWFEFNHDKLTLEDLI